MVRLLLLSHDDGEPLEPDIGAESSHGAMESSQALYTRSTQNTGSCLVLEEEGIPEGSDSDNSTQYPHGRLAAYVSVFACACTIYMYMKRFFNLNYIIILPIYH